jgi:hypothetical protein
MLRGSILAIVATLAGLAAAPSAGSQRTAIGAAAVAPVNALLERNPTKLCAAFVPAVAEALVVGRQATETCAAAAAAVFTRIATSPTQTVSRYTQAQVYALQVSGKHASAVISGAYATSSAPGAVSFVTLHAIQPLRISFERIDGTWLIASPARLGSVCVSSTCATGSETPLLSYGQPAAPAPAPSVAVPRAVRREGRATVREFERGRLGVMRSGCLACHRVGLSGNRGPGPNLTHAGSLLTEAQIARALIDPRPPMPSFKRLPKAQFRAVVRFLRALK